MLVTLVVRLVPERLAAGEFVGEVEDVSDGSQEVVRTVGELLDFARRAAAVEEKTPPAAGRGSASR